MVFDSYVRLLVSELHSKDIVLPDNLPVHQTSQVERVVTAVKIEVSWLPAYSPDFSLIENCWSLAKALKAITLDDIDGLV